MGLKSNRSFRDFPYYGKITKSKYCPTEKEKKKKRKKEKRKKKKEKRKKKKEKRKKKKTKNFVNFSGEQRERMEK